MQNTTVAVALTVALLIGAGGGYLLSTAYPRTDTTVSTSTLTSTALVQYPITFVGPPKGCSVQGFCINATLANHLGSNVTVLAVAWLRNATTGQNVTMQGGVQKSLVDATCTVDYLQPSVCYIFGYPESGSTFEVTLTMFGLDGKTALSPTVTANVTD